VEHAPRDGAAPEAVVTALRGSWIALLDRTLDGPILEGQVLDRTFLLEEVWKAPSDVRSRSLDTTLYHLREKLGPAGRLIRTIPGEGYRMESDENKRRL